MMRQTCEQNNVSGQYFFTQAGNGSVVVFEV